MVPNVISYMYILPASDILALEGLDVGTTGSADLRTIACCVKR